MKIRQPSLYYTRAMKARELFVKINSVQIGRFWMFVTSHLFYQTFYKVSQKDFICSSFTSTLKSPKIKVFSYFEECKSKNHSNIAKWLLITAFRRLKEQFTRYFSWYKFSSTLKLSISAFSVVIKQDEISSLTYNRIPPPLEFSSNL